MLLPLIKTRFSNCIRVVQMHVGRVNFIVLLRHMGKIGQIRDVLEEDANVK